jgi:hypothetical protein
MYVTDRLTGKNSSSKKLLLVIYGLSVSPLIINIPMNLQTDKVHQKNYPLYFINISIDKYNISPIKYHL